MEKDRLAAFSDGVFAIIITIMVLELKVPHDASLAALGHLWPVFSSYVLSFLYVAIYWNNHHHMTHTMSTGHVNGLVLWANMHLLFWISLIPFTTAWMGENHFQALPTALYGFSLLMPSIAYFLLQWAIIHAQGSDSPLRKAIGRDIKGKISPMLYTLGILASFFMPVIGGIVYISIALMWLIPDKRIEKKVAAEENAEKEEKPKAKKAK